jgi:hypothetical protein
VIVGPYEATAIGNALTQAIGPQTGQRPFASAPNRSPVIPPITVQPQTPAAFEAQMPRFAALLDR